MITEDDFYMDVVYSGFKIPGRNEYRTKTVGTAETKLGTITRYYDYWKDGSGKHLYDVTGYSAHRRGSYKTIEEAMRELKFFHKLGYVEVNEPLISRACTYYVRKKGTFKECMKMSEDENEEKVKYAKRLEEWLDGHTLMASHRSDFDIPR